MIGDVSQNTFPTRKLDFFGVKCLCFIRHHYWTVLNQSHYNLYVSFRLIFLSYCSRLVARIMIENKTYCFSSNQNVGWVQRPCFSSFHFLSSSNFSFFSRLRPFDVKLVYTHTNKRISRSMSSSIMYNKNKLLLSDFFIM